ncbi:MAG: hypothetical protein LBQ77_05060 [Treponema sp.]|jgi:hypothetical protein|nr:hypothetical protein [Treponema sp.]
MNIIPTTFNDLLPSYTAVGGSERGGTSGLSAVLLNRGGGYPRRKMFQELEKISFDHIISVESSNERYDITELSSRFPSVQFVFLKKSITTGEQINLASTEVSGPFFFVLWNDLRILNSGGALRMTERIASNPGYICTVPIIQSAHFDTLPTIAVPAASGSSVRSFLFPPKKDSEMSLYPFDGVGIYDKSRFTTLGGFDSTIKNTYWQLMDFGFRSYLWGEKIHSMHTVRLSYNGEPRVEDNTTDEWYRQFYLKNLAPVYRGDSALIPFRRFFSYWWHSKETFFNAWSEFIEAKRWTKTNRYRFKTDARAIIELWEDLGDRLENVNLG